MLVGNRLIGIIINILCVIQIIGIIIYLVVAWGNIPDQIPGHFGASGEVTRWDNKGTLFIMPGVAVVMFIVMSVVERYPHLWNTGVRVTEENKFRIYRILKGLLDSIKLVIVTMFSFITIIQSTAQELPSWFLPVILCMIFIPIVFHIVLLIRAR